MGSVRPSCVRTGSVRIGSVRPDSVRPGSARPCSVRPGDMMSSKVSIKTEVSILVRFRKTAKI